MSLFSKFHLNPANSAGLPGPPKAGEFVAARFTADDQWYRARIRRNDREAKKAEVVYIDFGNSEIIPWSRLRLLSQEFVTSKLKPQAVEAQLAYIQMPGNSEYLADAVSFISQETADVQLVAKVEATEKDGMLWVTLYNPSQSNTGTESINADLLTEGLAMVPKKLRPWERTSDILTAMKKKQDVAKEERRGQWEYGDLTEDD
jgi:staphylococcal nuclease domain-containing protein 1